MLTTEPVRTAYQPHIETLIGNTPLLGFNHITAHLPDYITIRAKAEWYNASGSVKDRAALNMVLTAEEEGLIFPGHTTLLDSTSGNTGIAYAMLGASRGYAVKLFVPANVSPERIAILTAYGADIVLTDPLEGSDGAIREARALAEAEPDTYYYLNQYDNDANWQAHFKTTGVEIWEQTEGQVTHFLAGLGTGGTLIGAGRRLKEFNAAIQVISLQPDSAFHGLEGLKYMETAIRPRIYDPDFPDRNISVGTEESYDMARRLAREEGYLVGISAAAAMVGALRIADELAGRDQPATVVTIFPDNASKYLSEPFWTK
jgi:cysteine synthase B